MRIVIATIQVPFVRGGAENLADGLLKQLKELCHEVEIVRIPFSWNPCERIPEHMLAFQLIDITKSCGADIDLMIALKFPAYLIPHHNKVMWLLHQHRTAYDLWEHPLNDLKNQPKGITVRNTIINADCKFIPEFKSIYTISNNVTQRLKKYCNIDSLPLYHPPLGSNNFYCTSEQGYLLYPSRITPEKRQLLVLEALTLTSEKVIVKFSGLSDQPTYLEYLKEFARNRNINDRIHWLGNVNEDEKYKLYAQSLGVIFPPIDEDYGYVTLEAMLSSKPIITCSDSGGTLEFVTHQETGLICNPTAESLAKAMDVLWTNRESGRLWGENGFTKYKDMNITWENVIEKLLT